MNKYVNRIQNIYCDKCEDEECLECNAIGIAKSIESEIRADERAKVIKQLVAELNPCVFCHDSTDCDKDYFFENCANEEYISWNELRLRAEKIKEQNND